LTKRSTLRLAALLTALALPACGGSGDGAGVSMPGGHKFAPERIEVAAGETIEFVNRSAESHTVTAFEEDLPATAEYFASGGSPSEAAARENLSAGLIKPGESFSVRLDAPGTYRYFCIPHETDGMTGEIVVSAPES